MSELDSFEYMQRQLLVSTSNVLLDRALQDIQQAPEGDAFRHTFGFVQDQYGDALESLAAMQVKLGVDASIADHPNDAAGLSNYSRVKVVENALHSIAGSPILTFNEKVELTDYWVGYTSGRRLTFSNRTRSRLFAVDSLNTFAADTKIKDARDIAAELSQRPLVRGAEAVESHLGWLSVYGSKSK